MPQPKYPRTRRRNMQAQSSNNDDLQSLFEQALAAGLEGSPAYMQYLINRAVASGRQDQVPAIIQVFNNSSQSNPQSDRDRTRQGSGCQGVQGPVGAPGFQGVQAPLAPQHPFTRHRDNYTFSATVEHCRPKELDNAA